MIKKCLTVLVVLLAVTISIAGCEKSDVASETKLNNSSTSENKVSASTTGNETNKTTKSNLEVFIDLLKETEAKSSFSTNSDYGGFIGTFAVNYNQQIVNPYTKASSIYAIDRLSNEAHEKDIDLSMYSGSVIVIAEFRALLKKYGEANVTYGCNESNKGSVMAVVFRDGFHAYEVDEKGNKKNAVTYMFPKFTE
ncbi:MAG: hypothetical protein N3B21_05095 [Clostridia bacterium]|nr:hypothetical protein [Clostridia bacterium]